MNPSDDFQELFACLNARSVRYLVVGGYAFAFHAFPRYTKVIDVLVDPPPENAHLQDQADVAALLGEESSLLGEEASE